MTILSRSDTSISLGSYGGGGNSSLQTHSSLSPLTAYPPPPHHVPSQNLCVVWRPIMISSCDCYAGPQFYVVTSEPTERIQLGSLVQDYRWGGPVVVLDVWTTGADLVVLRCSGRSSADENIIRFLVVNARDASIPWTRSMWRRWRIPGIHSSDKFRPLATNRPTRQQLPLPSARFSLSGVLLTDTVAWTVCGLCWCF